MLYVTNCAKAHSALRTYLIITVSSLGPSLSVGPTAPYRGWTLPPHTNLVALSCSVPCSHMGGRQTLSQESYFKSLCWTSSQALTRLSSMYIRKRMRSPQARLLVSCFRRLGLDLPLKPAGRESFCDSLGKPSRVEAQQPPWQHDLCVRSPITSATLHEPRQPAPRDESHTEALHPDAVPRPSWPEGPA